MLFLLASDTWKQLEEELLRATYVNPGNLHAIMSTHTWGLPQTHARLNCWYQGTGWCHRAGRSRRTEGEMKGTVPGGLGNRVSGDWINVRNSLSAGLVPRILL